MKKIMVAIVLISMSLFGYSIVSSRADDMTAGSGVRSDFTKLIGKTVKNYQGDILGTIREFAKGPEGEIAFAMLDYWASDTTRKIVAIPIGALSCGEQACMLNASRETVGTTPIYFSKDDLKDTRTASDIYLYFGLQPFWTEEETPGQE